MSKKRTNKSTGGFHLRRRSKNKQSLIHTYMKIQEMLEDSNAITRMQTNQREWAENKRRT